MNLTQDFVNAYQENNDKPSFFISTSYFRKESNLERIYTNNKRINEVLNDLLNPRRHPDFFFSINHFIEKRKRTLEHTKSIKIKNTITNEYEYDNEAEISKPVYDTHHLIGEIKDSVICNPNKNIKKVFLNLYGSNEPPQDLGYEQIKIEIMDYAIRKRCHKFIGKSKQSLKIIPEDSRRDFEGVYGYKGLIAYVTKAIRAVDDYSIFFDIKNSSIIPK